MPLEREHVPGTHGGRPKHRGRRLLARRGLWGGLALVVVAGSAVVVSQASADQKQDTLDLKKWYVLVNRNSGKVLDDRGAAKNDGAAVVQWARHGGANQQWQFIDAGDGYYRLKNRTSGKVLDDLGWSKTAGSALVQWKDQNASNQQFKLAKSSDGYLRLVNRFSGMAVGVDKAVKADGGNVVQNRDGSGADQQWKLVAVGNVSGGGTPTTPSGSAPASPAPSAPRPSSSPSSASPTPTAGGGSSTTRFMGSDKILIGGSMTDASANAAPFDMRYAYIHSQPAPSSEAYTASRCKAEWSAWWGCWGGTSTAPGNQVTWQDAQAAKATYQGKSRPQKYLWTWYSLRDLGDAAGEGDGPGEVKAINRTDLLTKYLNDYRFFLQKIGTSQDAIDLEPDFWGFARSLGNLHQVPAQVTASNPTDCGSQENSASGLAQCLISMARKYAPNTAVGLHLSCFNWESDLQACVKDYADLGAKNADFLATDVSDRDAGWYAQPAHGGSDHFWNDQKAAASLKFWKTMAESVGKPVVLWQIPVGNMAGNNTPGHFKDDKVDWFFGHMDQVANAHIAGLMFGAGWTEQTTPETDGGNLINKTIAYRNAGGTTLK
ncbi:RICIN domain-containing protein [Streptomyces acidiscabies]|uniref:RICIN domain-containing protein n=1 Tax=Streptomyces acidiscabies TaxID=42234 RepID=A0AAP6BIH2_9ACTN|nr:RICIN domain-containing protein [Streptomyces acidiscabies]MDX2965326.1 RICIN domain-containing protein [Streptomyces acidiscabies]MDX3024605.1 RICIN domain-containing protein [Streptomyces acidiscabies]MDX3795160.1 RICIN domain-containing protein [Streptomyces acidiscabies]